MGLEQVEATICSETNSVASVKCLIETRDFRLVQARKRRQVAEHFGRRHVSFGSRNENMESQPRGADHMTGHNWAFSGITRIDSSIQGTLLDDGGSCTRVNVESF